MRRPAVSSRRCLEPPRSFVPDRFRFCGRGLALITRGAVEEQIDRGGDELHVADFFDADALDEILKRLRIPARIEALEEILHHRAHLSELAAEALLKNVGSGRIRFVRIDRVNQILNVEKHTLGIRWPRGSWLPVFNRQNAAAQFASRTQKVTGLSRKHADDRTRFILLERYQPTRQPSRPMEVANIVVLKWIRSENVKAEPAGILVSIARFREPDLAGSFAPAFGGSRQDHTPKTPEGGKLSQTCSFSFPQTCLCQSVFKKSRLLEKK